MAMRKKGILFTLAAILMVSVISGSTSLVATYYLDEAQVSVVRLQTMNNFVSGVNDDFSLAMYAASFRSMVALQEYVADNGVYIDDAEQRMEELMFNGTLYGSNSSFMENNTVPSWLFRVREKAQTIGLDVNVSVSDIVIEHYDAWNVSVTVTYLLSVNDIRGLTGFSATQNQTSYVSILGFLDPVSIRETSNLVAVTINQTPYEGNFLPNIDEQIEDNYFATWGGAPSYLMRLEGNLSDSEFGIERLIDKEALSDNGIAIDAAASSADWEYWSTGAAGFTFNVGPPFFVLVNQTINGTSHIARYNLSGEVN